MVSPCFNRENGSFPICLFFQKATHSEKLEQTKGTQWTIILSPPQNPLPIGHHALHECLQVETPCTLLKTQLNLLGGNMWSPKRCPFALLLHHLKEQTEILCSRNTKYKANLYQNNIRTKLTYQTSPSFASKPKK